MPLLLDLLPPLLGLLLDLLLGVPEPPGFLSGLLLGGHDLILRLPLLLLRLLLRLLFGRRLFFEVSELLPLGLHFLEGVALCLAGLLSPLLGGHPGFLRLEHLVSRLFRFVSGGLGLIFGGLSILDCICKLFLCCLPLVRLCDYVLLCLLVGLDLALCPPSSVGLHP